MHHQRSVLIVLVPGTNPDFATQDLWESIQNGTYPGWTLYAQVLSPQDAQIFKYNVLDITKYVLLNGMLVILIDIV